MKLAMQSGEMQDKFIDTVTFKFQNECYINAIAAMTKAVQL